MGRITPSGIRSVDTLGVMQPTGLEDYTRAAADYIRAVNHLTDSCKKAAQIRLSDGLGEIFLGDLRHRLGPQSLPGAVTGETEVGGGLRAAMSDVTDFDRRDGVRLAVELKPVHLAVGRAIWNRLGDVRVFAVNLHLKFPFAVVAAVLTVPTEERLRSRDDDQWKSTVHLVEKLSARVRRAACRDIESGPAHLLEAAAVVVFDRRTGEIDLDLPGVGSGLRWDECLDRVAELYAVRFDL